MKAIAQMIVSAAPLATRKVSPPTKSTTALQWVKEYGGSRGVTTRGEFESNVLKSPRSLALFQVERLKTRRPLKRDGSTAFNSYTRPHHRRRSGVSKATRTGSRRATYVSVRNAIHSVAAQV